MHSHFLHLSDAELLHLLRGVYFRRAESPAYVAVAAILSTLAAVSIRSPILGIFFYRHPATLAKLVHIISSPSNNNYVDPHKQRILEL